MSTTLNLDYPGILNHIQRYIAGVRTESEAFLVWFLQYIYRLEETDAEDVVCDGPDDKGVDGIYIDDNLERIDIFQSKLVTSNKARTLGDVQLKEFVGTLSQFSDPNKILQIANTTSNSELRNLLLSQDVAAKVRNGYSLKGVLVTNVSKDRNAELYLASQPNLVVYDRDMITTSYVPVGPTSPMAKPIEFDVYGYDCAVYYVGQVQVVLAPLRATELIRLDGLANGALFSWNVRQSLGKTKVNKEISRSVRDASEHRNFLLYHNGLTILCSEIKKRDDRITISGYSVVNGCQSLTTLYESKDSLSDDLRIFSRLIELPPDSELAAKITHHSNNQNSINPRDLQSNSGLQRRLQNEFDKQFGGKVFYQIKRGEQSFAPEIIDNEEAARVLLAFDLRQPWTCHQTYKLFDELHTDLFARPEVTALRIYALNLIYEAVVTSLPSLVNFKLMSNYRLTRYFLIYLLRQVLEADEIGKRFCAKPDQFVNEQNGPKRLKECVTKVLEDLIVDLNAELQDRKENNNAFDYKRELKSPKAVKTLEKDVIPQYLKAVKRGRATSFGQEWESSS